MCGIVGFVGKKQSSKFLLNKLKMLEYRGYDSAGYAGIDNGKIVSKKCVGEVQNLARIASGEFSCEIAHTRWATHGIVCEKNCHPHISNGGVWAIVHNGIIENYAEINEILKSKTDSDTDTASVSELLEEKQVSTIQDFIKTFDKILGSFAIVAINKQKNDEMFLAKRKSPLFVCKNQDNEFLVASDPICFQNFSDKYVSFNDDEFAHIKNGKIKFYAKLGQNIVKKYEKMPNNFEFIEKGKYSTFMEKEIFDENQALKNQVAYYKNSKILEKIQNDFMGNIEKIKLIGCGTAYHASEIGAKYIKKISNIDASAEYASEFIYFDPVEADKKTLFIFVSQSGETADTIRAFEIAKQNGAKCVALTNVMYSTLARLSDLCLPVCAGVEVAVASTKAYVCQLSALYMLACHLGNIRLNKKQNYFDDILNLSEKILNFNEDKLENFAKIIDESKQVMFIGKDIDFITASETALKLKETTYIYSGSYPSGELKHGYLALVENGVTIMAFASNKKINSKTINSLKEAEARGGKTIIFTNSETSEFENVIYFDEENEFLLPMLEIAQFQFLCCKICKKKNINPDRPKNLAKSVTVE